MRSFLQGPRTEDFFIQEHLGEAWHVESEEHCEFMLCRKFISVDSGTARIQHRWGTKRCPDCWLALEIVKRARRGE